MGSKCRFYVDVQTLNSRVTGSCHLGIVKYPNGSTTRFVVDCGLFQGDDEEENKNQFLSFDADKIDFVLVTHNHVDHIGRLPLLYKNGYTGQVYTTKDTAVLLQLALYDCHRVLKDNAKRAHQPVLYSEGDVTSVLSHIVPVSYESSIMLDEHIKVTFFRNGHLVGASMILVELSYPGEKSINWLFTGDYNNSNMFFDVPVLPERVRNLPLNVMQEATYGDMDSIEVEPCFEKNILAALEKKNATVVVPVFSLGRSQEILFFLQNLQKQGKLSLEVPIFFDGTLAKRYTNLYISKTLELKTEMMDFLPKNLHYVDSSSRSTVLENSSTKIIVTTSGMGSYGPAPQYISTFIKQPNALIHFTGYTAQGTMGSKLKTAQIGDIVSVGGLRVEKQAQVEYTTEFSAHAKADEMIAFLKQFSSLHLVLVNHGEEETKEHFAKRIIKEVKPADVGVACREIFFRVSAYHLIKTLTTKFQ